MPKTSTNWHHYQWKADAMQNIFIIKNKWKNRIHTKKQYVENCHKSIFEEIISF